MTGKYLSHYLIESELGRGGMGIVYRAKDTKLDRTVAIKVLPAAALGSEDDRARFYREAKAAAALTHPHIAIIHGVDEAVVEGDKDEELRPFIAMEFIEGATLEDRISKGPLKLEDALRIAREIASALKLAHANEIVHRDIKSANVMLTGEGTAKVLDFGLAQTAQSTKLTRMGSTLGTVAYMSPEQARGDAVDSRTDLYSLGTVLYEMITGRLPFGGEYEQAVVYSILNQEPEPITALRTGVPMELERIVNKLLAKEAGRRYQSCADLIVDLESVTLGTPSHGLSTASVSTSSFSTIGKVHAPAHVTAAPATKHRFYWGIVAAAVLVGLGLGLFGSAITEPEPALEPLQKVEISLPGMSDVRFTRISPDGSYFAFVAVDDQGREGIFLRELATDRIRFIEDTQEGERLGYDFSPDGTQIAFTSVVNNGVFTVEVPSGIPERQTEFGRFLYWEDSDTILFTDDKPGGDGTFRLDLSSGNTTPVPLNGPALPEGYNYIVKTHVPGSNRVFGHELRRLPNNLTIEGDHKVFTADLSTGLLESIEPFTINPEYVAGGFLMYQLRDDDGKLVVRPVNEKTGQFTGQPLDVFDEGMSIPWSGFSISSNGDLLFTLGSQSFSAESSLWQVDLERRRSSRLGITLPVPLQASDPRLSADESRIIFRAALGGPGDIYEYDRDELLQYQLTSDRRNYQPTYDPVDGGRVFSRRFSDNGREIVRLQPGPLSSASPDVIWGLGSGPAFSDDGRWMAFVVRDSVDTEVDMILLDRSTDEIVWKDSTGSTTFLPHFSPDSRYLAYNRVVNQEIEIVVVPVSGLPKFVIPNTPGEGPRWSGDGNYLFYWNPGSIQRIPIRTQPTFNILGEPELVMPLQNHRGWDVSSDGNTIFVVATNVDFGDEKGTDTTVYWWQNWSDHLKREFSK